MDTWHMNARENVYLCLEEKKKEIDLFFYVRPDLESDTLLFFFPSPSTAKVAGWGSVAVIAKNQISSLLFIFLAQAHLQSDEGVAL